MFVFVVFFFLFQVKTRALQSWASGISLYPKKIKMLFFSSVIPYVFLAFNISLGKSLNIHMPPASSHTDEDILYVQTLAAAPY